MSYAQKYLYLLHQKAGTQSQARPVGTRPFFLISYSPSPPCAVASSVNSQHIASFIFFRLLTVVDLCVCHDTCKLDACVLPSHDSISAKQAGPDERIFVFLLALPFCLLIVDLLSAHPFAISTISARMRGYALPGDGPPSRKSLAAVGCCCRPQI